MPGCICCANAAEPASKLPSSAAQASIRLEEKAFNVSASGQQGIRESYQARLPAIAASGGSVTSFPRHRCGRNLTIIAGR
jgi:hypothetical protein